MAEKWDDDLSLSGIYILGGVDTIIKYFIYLQDQLDNNSKE